MRHTYTAGQFRRSERRIRKNARVVVDNFGCTMQITRSRRILAVLNPMTGEWQGPSLNDGVTRRGSPYVYVPAGTNLTETMTTESE